MGVQAIQFSPAFFMVDPYPSYKEMIRYLKR